VHVKGEKNYIHLSLVLSQFTAALLDLTTAFKDVRWIPRLHAWRLLRWKQPKRRPPTRRLPTSKLHTRRLPARRAPARRLPARRPTSHDANRDYSATRKKYALAKLTFWKLWYCWDWFLLGHNFLSCMYHLLVQCIHRGALLCPYMLGWNRDIFKCTTKVEVETWLNG